MKPKDVSTDVPEWVDTTPQMSQGRLSISDYKGVDITNKIKAIASRLLNTGCIYLNKEKLSVILKEQKMKKFSLEVKVNLVYKKSVRTRRICFTKLNHSVFLCPNLEDLVSLLLKRKGSESI
jgi:hypothetical protein